MAKYAWAGQVIENPSQDWLDSWVELVLAGAVQDGDLIELESDAAPSAARQEETPA